MTVASSSPSSFREDFARLRCEFALACDLQDLGCPSPLLVQKQLEEAEEVAREVHADLLAVKLFAQSATAFLLALDKAYPHVPRDMTEAIVAQIKTRRRRNNCRL
eukprot:CAMPEP_0197493342 /NCGR_PEP_ID=MMETSP1311-20131121/21231_1 /TAXON_ID=464262 /ORGANISM="Genus nov. species nov., Strain RCC856" /LENGTH=104 /DNA_ID=CAMNT_0043038573 /DNA_START=271 /DNA_END=585 /DNA_ORIENTATION=-